MLRQATRMATAAGATVAAAASAMAANTSSDAEISSDELGFDGQPARVFKPIDFSKYKMDHHLLHHSLAGEGKLEKYEVHLSVDRQHLRAYARLGEKACGHPQVIHGGAIASLLDDAMGTLFLSTGLHGFTANLSIDYRKPLVAGTDAVIVVGIDRIETSKSSGSQKIFLKAALKSADEKVTFTEASALFVAKSVPAGGMLDNLQKAQAIKESA